MKNKIVSTELERNIKVLTRMIKLDRPKEKQVRLHNFYLVIVSMIYEGGLKIGLRNFIL